MTTTDETLTTIDRFNEAFNAHDVDAVMKLMTDDAVFESTAEPDGERFEGQAAVRGFWEYLFEANPDCRFDAESIFGFADRGIVHWRFIFDKTKPDGGHVRGVDIFTVRDGKVPEKLAYVKSGPLSGLTR